MCQLTQECSPAGVVSHMNGRVRDYLPDDLPAVIELVQASVTRLTGTIGSFLDGATAFVHDDGGRITGLAAATQPRRDDGGHSARFRLCVHPQHRRQGIGDQLWQAISPRIADAGASLVTTSYRSDHGDGPGFFAARGFRPWFQAHYLAYTGPGFPEPQLDAIHYEDRFFADYLTMINDGFTDLRRTNDMAPYVIFGPDSFQKDELRREMLGNRDNTYVFLDSGEMIGLAELDAGDDGDAVHTIAVKPACRGRGLGRAITQFSINRMRERGVQRVFIDVIGTNTVARSLYDSLGFTHVETIEAARRRQPFAPPPAR